MQQQLLTLSEGNALPENIESLANESKAKFEGRWIELGMADASKVIKEWRIWCSSSILRKRRLKLNY